MIPVFEAAVTAQFLTSRVLPRLAEMPNVPPLTDRPFGTIRRSRLDGRHRDGWRAEWGRRL